MLPSVVLGRRNFSYRFQWCIWSVAACPCGIQIHSWLMLSCATMLRLSSLLVELVIIHGFLSFKSILQHPQTLEDVHVYCLTEFIQLRLRQNILKNDSLGVFSSDGIHISECVGCWWVKEQILLLFLRGFFCSLTWLCLALVLLSLFWRSRSGSEWRLWQCYSHKPQIKKHWNLRMVHL